MSSSVQKGYKRILGDGREANELGILPGILATRMARDGQISRSLANEFKAKIQVSLLHSATRGVNSEWTRPAGKG